MTIKIRMHQSKVTHAHDVQITRESPNYRIG